MAQEKLGDTTRNNLMKLFTDAAKDAGFEVLITGSNSLGIPSVENGDETAVKVVFQIPKGERGGAGYDVFEDAQAYAFKCEEAEKKRKKKTEEKAKKLAKQNKTE